MKRPMLLDLFCGAGGAAMGYYRAGFDVYGIDINPQPNYPFRFLRGDALEFAAKFGREFDAIHASPPCQAYSFSTVQWRKLGREYPDMVADTRQCLMSLGKPWIIENVTGSPLNNPLLLCGTMFGLMTKRHRLFEMSHPVYFTPPCAHVLKTAKIGRPAKEDEYIEPVGHFPNLPQARQAMGIDWMNKKELSQAIPPAYTEFLGKQLIKYVKG